MPTVVEVTDPLRSIYRTVPPSGPGVCTVCHSQPNAGFDVCSSCYAAMSRVSHPTRRVVPVSLMSKDGQLYYALRRYKDVIPSAASGQLQRAVAATIGRFLDGHGPCIQDASGRAWDTVTTTVPSTRRRPGVHPLAAAVRMLPQLGAMMVDTLRANAAGDGADRDADDARFELIASVSGRSIPIVDDTLTTGARIQSAASRLAHGGATVVAAVPVGRLVNPERSPDVWAASVAEPYDFGICCLQRHGRPSSSAAPRPVGPSHP